MANRIAIAAGLLALVMGLGCVHHVHHHHKHAQPAKKVLILDREHEDTTIVVVHDKPGPRRHCWKHRRHWHCRAR